MTHASIVIAMTAVLDGHLEGAIKKQFRALSADLHGKIFEFPGPLSSFASKIYLAYAMKIVSKDVYDELNKVRKIRNTMAHTSDLLHLTSPEIKSVFESLKKPKDIKERPALVFARCVVEICANLSSANVEDSARSN